MKKNDKLNPMPRGTTPFFAIIILACSILVYTKIPKAAIILAVCAIFILAEKLEGFCILRISLKALLAGFYVSVI